MSGELAERIGQVILIRGEIRSAFLTSIPSVFRFPQLARNPDCCGSWASWTIASLRTLIARWSARSSVRSTAIRRSGCAYSTWSTCSAGSTWASDSANPSADLATACLMLSRNAHISQH